MRLRFKSLLIVITALIISCIIAGIGYQFYEHTSDDGTVVVVDGNITINYLNGNTFSASSNEELEFSVTNNSKEKAYYYIRISDVKGDADSIFYEIKSKTNDINIANKLKSEIVSNSIAIEANETATYTMAFKNETDENYSGKIMVVSKQGENRNFADIILENNEVKEEPITKLGESATTDEGLIKNTDDFGVSYYFRGNVQNNYLAFADLTWRIVKVNGDGSVKVVLDGLIEDLSKYYEGEDFEFEHSVINKSLNTWYESKLANYSEYVVNTKYCNDYVIDETKKTYVAYDRIAINKIPTFECLGAISNSRIGLLTADEAILAGASLEENISYYLYNSNIKNAYFTQTSAKVSEKYYPFVILESGKIDSDVDGTLVRGVRPVINIIKTATVTGSGTSEDPYKVL